MEVSPTIIPGLLQIQPRVFRDDRGMFIEHYHQERYAAAGIAAPFVQDNVSSSHRHVLRGLHYQVERPQAKLLWVQHGEICDVVVDLRRSSPTFGRWHATTLSAANFQQLYLPPGLAHGFLVLSEFAEVWYKCSAPYAPELERTIVWNDAALAIAWPITSPTLSPKDQRGLSFAEAPKFA